MDRRSFLKVAGTSGAAAAAGGCTGHGPERLIPYLIPVENLQPGVSAEYATVCRECPAGCGMIARVRDGRVHKVEGNPDHPLNRGALCLRGQSVLQDVYNPDRLRQPLARDPQGRLQPIAWDEAERRLAEALAGARGGRVAWIGRLETGPFGHLAEAWLGAVAPSHVRLRYEPLAYEPLREAHARVFGREGVPDLRIAEARMLLGFGAEFLETWVSNVQYARDFSAWRQARVNGKHAARYVCLSPHLSLTGANADEWVPIRPGAEALIARALTAVVAAERGARPGPGGEVAALAAAGGLPAETMARLGREFAAAPSLAFPVGTTAAGTDAVAANEAILRLNQAAGNIGRTVLMDRPHALGAAARYREMAALVAAMRRGEISLLLVHEANPVYHLPPALGVEEAIRRVPAVVSFSSYLDETTALASLVLPDHRPLESWGAYSPRPGITGLLQPVIMPVFDTRATGDVLLAVAHRLGHDLGAPDFHAYLRRALGLDEAAWQAALQRGGVFAPRAPTRAPARAPARARARNSAVAAIDYDYEQEHEHEQEHEQEHEASPLDAVQPPFGVPPAAAEASPLRLTLLLYPSLHFFDGRTANRPWAQEIPEPMAKAVWGSWAELHPEAAQRLGVQRDDLLVLSTAAGRLEVPALVTERVHPEVIALQLGQGHTEYGRYAAGTGVNPLALLPGAVDPASGALVMSGVPVSVTRAPVQRPIVVLQTSHEIVSGDIAREIPLSKQPSSGESAAQEEAKQPSLYRYTPPGKHHWGMVIDLDRCIGCNACVAACYAENNVPVVGREACARGREMSWLRIENYQAPGVQAFRRSGVQAASSPTPERLNARTPGTVFLPMLCQQCNNAPCEYVCPVDASVHDSEGLNQQVYNRCVGTRFCSNNCPYKVRRFNWFTYDFPPPLDQQLNPDVIHRTKGIMEKCSFCIQRIRRGKIEAAAAGRPLQDGEIVTACQQTCPTDAIIFGDLNDPHSRVRQLAADPRGYGALAHLNTFPNITYLARVRAEEG